jgi:hypothetical protein
VRCLRCVGCVALLALALSALRPSTLVALFALRDLRGLRCLRYVLLGILTFMTSRIGKALPVRAIFNHVFDGEDCLGLYFNRNLLFIRSVSTNFLLKMSQNKTGKAQTILETTDQLESVDSPTDSEVGNNGEDEELSVVDVEDMVVMLVQRYELIYNLRHRDHMNKQKKEMAWIEIGQKVGISGKFLGNSQ